LLCKVIWTKAEEGIDFHSETARRDGQGMRARLRWTGRYIMT
jgi:hypothetical protein